MKLPINEIICGKNLTMGNIMLSLCADRVIPEKAGHPEPPCCTIISGTITGDSNMKRIPLTQGKFAIVDNKDFEWLNQHKWRAHWNKDTRSFYATRESKRENGNRHTIFMAREILGLKKGDKRQADHIGHVTLDNRRPNLRIVTPSQNQWNRKNPKGYYWHKTNQKYLAQIKVNGKSVHLGYFHTTKEAHGAYLTAKEKYHKF